MGGDLVRMRFVTRAPSRNEVLACVQSRDTVQEVATNADWSAGLRWGGADGVRTVVDLVRGRWTLQVVKGMAEVFAKK